METLRFGSRGAQVEYLQLALQRAGYRDLALDGISERAQETRFVIFSKGTVFSRTAWSGGLPGTA